MIDHARKAANFASRIDFWLAAASSDHLPEDRRNEALFRSFKQFVGLLDAMRKLKADHPAIYAQAEAAALSAREIEGGAA